MNVCGGQMGSPPLHQHQAVGLSLHVPLSRWFPRGILGHRYNLLLHSRDAHNNKNRGKKKGEGNMHILCRLICFRRTHHLRSSFQRGVMSSNRKIRPTRLPPFFICFIVCILFRVSKKKKKKCRMNGKHRSMQK